MFPKRSTPYLLILSVFIIISFDAFQQKFYLDTFNLYPDNPITLLDLLNNHLTRWLIWSVVSISFILFSWNKFSSNEQPVNLSDWILIFLTALISNLVSVLLISVYNLIDFGSVIEFNFLKEQFTFIFFQKGLSFTFASCLLILLVYNRANSLIIDAQWVEINHLKEQSSKSFDGEKPNLTIKIGNKHKVIPISDVLWFEADDYCVKVHTSQKSFTMRKSLKSLEKELSELNFVRVHRKALLNLEYLDHVNFSDSTVQLKNNSEIDLSKSGAMLLKKVLHTTSL